MKTAKILFLCAVVQISLIRLVYSEERKPAVVSQLSTFEVMLSRDDHKFAAESGNIALDIEHQTLTVGNVNFPLSNQNPTALLTDKEGHSLFSVKYNGEQTYADGKKGHEFLFTRSLGDGKFEDKLVAFEQNKEKDWVLKQTLPAKNFGEKMVLGGRVATIQVKDVLIGESLVVQYFNHPVASAVSLVAGSAIDPVDKPLDPVGSPELPHQFEGKKLGHETLEPRQMDEASIHHFADRGSMLSNPTANQVSGAR